MSTGIICALNSSGDRQTPWDTADRASVETARSEFTTLKAAGHVLFRLDGPNNDGTALKAFDETAERVIAFAPLQAG